MALTVSQAFNEFQMKVVDLEPSITERARASKDWLLDRIDDVCDIELDSVNSLNYGSFSRRTKIRPLDDIDLMIALDSSDIEPSESQYHVRIKVTKQNSQLQKYCFNGEENLNSRRVINALVKGLSQIPNYEKAKIHRCCEACVLNLKNYPWSFDIVPCFYVSDRLNRHWYYLVPDGNGNWKKTDPRVDKERVSRINQNYEGRLLDIIRLVKYWNMRPTMPSISSYLLESLVIGYYEKYHIEMKHISVEFSEVIAYLQKAILRPLPDPKGFEDNINKESSDVKSALYCRARIDHNSTLKAISYMYERNHRVSIRLWRSVFGSEFPIYG